VRAALVQALQALAAGQSQIVEALERAREDNFRASEIRRIEALLIPPVFSPRSSGSSRSPRPDERLDLKIAVIEYYGLWSARKDPLRDSLVHTMLPNTDAEAAAGATTPVPFSEAILAHIWPSGHGHEGGVAHLHLAEDFHVDPRNFLILRKGAEVAFDADALLLFPRRGSADGTICPTAVSRRFPAKEARIPIAHSAEFAGYHGRTLFLPNAAAGRVPCMRLLGWKAVSALRADAEAADATAALPDELHLDATATRDDACVSVLSARVQHMRGLGMSFRAVRVG